MAKLQRVLPRANAVSGLGIRNNDQHELQNPCCGSQQRVNAIQYQSGSGPSRQYALEFLDGAANRRSDFIS